MWHDKETIPHPKNMSLTDELEATASSVEK